MIATVFRPFWAAQRSYSNFCQVIEIFRKFAIDPEGFQLCKSSFENKKLLSLPADLIYFPLSLRLSVRIEYMCMKKVNDRYDASE